MYTSSYLVATSTWYHWYQQVPGTLGPKLKKLHGNPNNLFLLLACMGGCMIMRKNVVCEYIFLFLAVFIYKGKH